MDRVWLEDYAATEREESRQFLRTLVDRKIPFGELYPRKDRFTRLHGPISMMGHQHVWAQLPFYGSSICPLIPRQESEFLRINNLQSIRDIDKLVDLAKNTGRIQFVLTSSPENYAGLDFLDVVFKELRPPMVISLPNDYFISEKEYRKYYIEFISVAKIKFIPMLRMAFGTLPGQYFSKRISDYARDYVFLNALGYNELAEQMLNLTIDNPVDAHSFFTIFGNMLVTPNISPLELTYNPIESSDREALSSELLVLGKYGRHLPESKPGHSTFPFEIGKLLMKKLTFLPESYDACISMMDKYQDTDLTRLLGAVQQGLIEMKIDIVNSKEKELEIVFEDLWTDSNRPQLISQGIHYGVLAELGVVGALATAPIAGIGGILAGLGYEVADRLLGLSKGAADFVSPSHLVIINDFRTKYSVE